MSRNHLSLVVFSMLLCAPLGLGACKKSSNEYGLGPDQDGDGWPFELDCNDRDDTVYPAADEIPGDGVDQDCSGSDLSLDGLGGAGGAPSGPGNTDGSGGLEGTGGGHEEPEPGESLDLDADGYDATVDCDDSRIEVNPGAIELLLNGVDENCDGSDLIGEGQSVRILSSEAVVGEVPDLAVVIVDGEEQLMAVWADSRVAARQSLYGQLLSFEGQALGEEFRIDETDLAAKSGVRLASKGDTVLVTWATADGIFAQQLAADGTTRGIRFGLADAGAQAPRPSYGGEDAVEGGSWAVAWRVPGAAPGEQARLRAMTTDVEAIRAPTQFLGGAAGAAVAPTVVGYGAGFMAVWEGASTDGRALWAQTRSRTGLAVGEPFIVHAGSASESALAFDGESFFVSFRMTGTFGRAAAVQFSAASNERHLAYLSAESIGQARFRSVVVDGGVFSLWADSRHLGTAPGIRSVYGNHWRVGEEVSWSYSRAFYADTQAELGGVARHGDDVYFVVLASSGPRLAIYSAN